MRDESAVQHLKGRPVRTWDGEEIGVLQQVLVDPSDGLPLFGVIALPGRLRLVKRLHPVPWLLFSQKPGAKEVILNLPKGCVEESPTLKREEDGLDDSYRRGVYDYFDQAACVRPVEPAEDEAETPLEPPASGTLGAL